jgi:abhydrolase domain-containing protein 12
VLAIDYRGFGLSTGSPTEEGLITDGIAAVNWAVQVAKVPTEQIVIFGHSLGTAVSVAVAEHFAKQGTDFAGIILYAALANLPSVLLDPSLLGLLYPLRMVALSKDYLAYLIVEFWETGRRIETLLTLSKRSKLYLIHALDDYEIRPHQTSELVLSALRGACRLDDSRPPIDRLRLQYFKKGLAIDLGDGASYTVYGPRGTNHLVTEHIIPYGCKWNLFFFTLKFLGISLISCRS